MEDKPKRRRKVDDDAKLAEAIRKCAKAIIVLNQEAARGMFGDRRFEEIATDMHDIIVSVASVNAGHALKDPT